MKKSCFTVDTTKRVSTCIKHFRFLWDPIPEDFLLGCTVLIFL